MTRLARSNRVSEAPSPIPPPALSLLSAALARGADGEMLERLIGFHERSQAHEARKAFEKALAAAKAKIPVIAKNRQAILGRQPHRHEDLAEIAGTITPTWPVTGCRIAFARRAQAQL